MNNKQEKKTTVEDAKIKIKKRSENFSQWYLDVIAAGKLADYSPVRGCMVIMPNGYSVWENIQRVLDKMFKDTGHKNAYFPIFIPESFLKKEAEHVKGFSPELAVVNYAGGKKLEEKLVVRPTSETIIYDSYAKWIQSWRDLPVLINQWGNVVRWEMKTKPFLRTTEFLWQEGHTAHATYEEAEKEALQMLNVYQKFVEEYLALSVVIGRKSESEKFAGALDTYTLESLMQDKKALQCGTSHNLGQNFAKAFDISFLDQEGNEEYVWQTSWGVSTRLIGALIMTHGDDKGVVMPPRISPLHLVFVPIWKNKEEKKKNTKEAQRLAESLPEEVRSHIDDRDIRPGWRYYEWERRGTPLRIEIGPNDVEKNQSVLVRRDTGEKITVPNKDFSRKVVQMLEIIQKNLFERAKKMQEENTHTVETWEDFCELIRTKGGFIKAPWCGLDDCEAKIKEETKATIRCIPFDESSAKKSCCIYCGKQARDVALFAQAY